MESFCKSLSETKKVTKPWGYELWIASNHTGSRFAMKEIFITENDVKRMIGLRTNASELTKTQFLKRLCQYKEI